MENEDENFAYTINIYFHPDNDRACVYVWNIITFEDADFSRVLRVVNELNYTYKYTRFYVDETDNTVTCALTLILHDDADAGDIVLEGLLRMNYLPSSAVIRNNDEVVTSGSTIYPRDLIVGYVVDAGFDDTGVAKYALLQPAVNIGSLEQVFIVTEYDAG
jgi:hypothetical protein